MEYTVTWRIHIDADSPQEAAVWARDIQRDRESIATCFIVVDREGNSHFVDLVEDKTDVCGECGQVHTQETEIPPQKSEDHNPPE